MSVVKSHAQSSPEAEFSSGWAHYNPNSAIRQHLRQWQEDQAKTPSPTRSKSISGLGGFGLIDNTVTQSGEDDLNAPSKTNKDDAEWDFGLDVDFESFLEEVKPPEALIARGDMTDVRYVARHDCTKWRGSKAIASEMKLCLLSAHNGSTSSYSSTLSEAKSFTCQRPE